MSPTAHGRLGIAGIALLLGLLADGLLRAGPWGINFTLWFLVAVAGGWALLPDDPGERPSITGWPVVGAIAFAGFVAWRDAPFLRFWNVVAVIGLLVCPVVNVLGKQFRSLRVVDAVGAGIVAARSVVQGLFQLPTADAPWRNRRYGALAGSVLVGLALSVPIALVFGGLLMSADPGFAKLVDRLTGWDLDQVATHVFLIGFFTWVSGGYLRGLLADHAPKFLGQLEEVAGLLKRGTVGLTEIAIPLGLLITLFSTFVVLQMTYLFGGEEVIQRTAGLTYAEYARGGFFELVVVATLLLPILFGAEWFVGADASRARRAFRGMAGALLGLMGVMGASALLRMRLYTNMYGLTHDRLYATAFMVWMGIVLVTFAATILRGHRSGFVFGISVSALGVLAALNLLNPDATIARVNLSRADTAVPEVDTQYLGWLSADALPTMGRALPRLDPTVRCALAGQTTLPRADEADWRTWNWGRWRAQSAVAELRAARASCRESEPVVEEESGEEDPGAALQGEPRADSRE